MCAKLLLQKVSIVLCFSISVFNTEFYCGCKIKCTNIFEVPEMAERTVPEKKVPPALSKKTEASLPKGTCHHYYHCKKGCYSLFRVFLNESQFKLSFTVYSDTKNAGEIYQI